MYIFEICTYLIDLIFWIYSSTQKLDMYIKRTFSLISRFLKESTNFGLFNQEVLVKTFN